MRMARIAPEPRTRTAHRVPVFLQVARAIMQPVIDWNDLRFLQAVRDRGTLAAASETLRVDATTVRRRIDALERALGIRLLERTKLGVALTPAGERAYAAAARAS